MSDFTIRVGANIKRYREAKGLTAGELAKKLGMSQPNLTKIEHGEPKKVDYILLGKIADILEVSKSDITGWEDEDAKRQKHEKHLQSRCDKALEKYARLSFADQKIVNGVIDSLLHKTPATDSESEILRKIRYLSEESRGRILNQLDYEYNLEREKQKQTSA